MQKVFNWTIQPWSEEKIEVSDIEFLDLFAGIGGFRLGMEQAGHESVGYVEWDKFARKLYQAIHDIEGVGTANDIRSISDGAIRGIGSVGIICGGFPCQAFSVVGKRKVFKIARLSRLDIWTSCRS